MREEGTNPRRRPRLRSARRHAPAGPLLTIGAALLVAAGPCSAWEAIFPDERSARRAGLARFDFELDIRAPRSPLSIRGSGPFDARDALKTVAPAGNIKSTRRYPRYEPPDDRRIKNTLRSDARLIGRWTRSFVTGVVPRDRRDRRFLLVLAGASIYSGARKQHLRHEHNESPILADDDKLYASAKELGEWPSLAAGAGLLYAVGLFSDSPGVRDTGLMLGESLLATALAINTLQFLFAEERPEEGGELDYFRWGGHGASGHAAVAMSLTRVIDYRFLRLTRGESPSRRTAKILGKTAVYSAAAFTGLSRVRDDKHYWWNVVLGSGIGYYVTGVSLRAHDAVRGEPRSRSALPRFSVGAGHSGAPGFWLTWSH